MQQFPVEISDMCDGQRPVYCVAAIESLSDSLQAAFLTLGKGICDTQQAHWDAALNGGHIVTLFINVGLALMLSKWNNGKIAVLVTYLDSWSHDATETERTVKRLNDRQTDGSTFTTLELRGPPFWVRV